MRTFALAMLVLSLPLGAATAQEAGFISLLDDRELPGWKQCGQYGWEVRDGIAVTKRAGASDDSSVIWYAKRTFGDFIMRFEFEGVNPDSVSGIHFHFPDPGDQFETVRDKGHRVTITPINAEKMPSGSIPPFREAKRGAQNRSNWNEMEIAVIGPAVCIKMNGEVVNQFLSRRQSPGYIGVQNHPHGPVRIRRLRVRDLEGVANPAAALDPSVLEYAVTHRDWDWTSPAGVRSLRFLPEGVADLGGGAEAKWYALDPYRLRMITKSGTIDLKFHRDYQSYVEVDKYESPIAGRAVWKDPICGTWKWFDGNIRVMRPDGTFTNLQGKPGGRWYCKNQSAGPSETRHYKITFTGSKFEDHLALLSGETFLEGPNNYRFIVRAYRVSE